MAASMPYTSDSAAATPETLSNGRFGAEGNGGGRGGGGGGGDDLRGILSTGFTLSPRSCWEFVAKLSLHSFRHGHELHRERAAPSTFVSLAPCCCLPIL